MPICHQTAEAGAQLHFVVERISFSKWGEGRGEMGLPKPLGPYQVSFQEFELRRFQGAHSGVQNGGVSDDRNGKSDGATTLPGAQGAPLIRIFYPTTAKTRWSLLDVKTRSWVPNLMYVYGFVSKAVAPTSALRRSLVNILSCKPLSFSNY